jgi:hypothetical protein
MRSPEPDRPGADWTVYAIFESHEPCLSTSDIVTTPDCESNQGGACRLFDPACLIHVQQIN